jgi:hypothetical protein
MPPPIPKPSDYQARAAHRAVRQSRGGGGTPSFESEALLPVVRAAGPAHGWSGWDMCRHARFHGKAGATPAAKQTTACRPQQEREHVATVRLLRWEGSRLDGHM